MKRAERTSIQLPGLGSADELAKEILKTIQDLYESEAADAWDFATAAEACIALNNPVDALEWISGYARMPFCDAFNLASTLRQMEEVWQLDMKSETGRLILPILRAELIKREGSELNLSIEDLTEQKETEKIVSTQYELLAKPGNEDSPREITLQKVFNNDSLITYKKFMTGADRCRAVVKIETKTEEGFGTGFVLPGNLLHESLGEEPVLLTNAHVVSDDAAEKALRSDEVVVVFEVLNSDVKFHLSEIIWSSPSGKLDTTIARFAKNELPALTEMLRSTTPYPVSKYLPSVDPPEERVYVIGHPYGGTMRLSLENNIFLDHESPIIHYRTATDEGSSGSPVFNAQWDLIGIHHAGPGENGMRRLNGKEGFYEANEGMWIQAVRSQLDAALTKTE
jgi:V8-like Glu-specific endopeptidase